MEQMLPTLIAGCVIAFLIAHFLGKKRQIGFGWSLFFSIFLTPIGGFITTMLSPKFYDSNPPPSKAKKTWGYILMIWFAVSGIIQLIVSISGHGNSLTPNSIAFCIGMVGLGYYLLELGQGRNFTNTKRTKEYLNEQYKTYDKKPRNAVRSNGFKEFFSWPLYAMLSFFLIPICFTILKESFFANTEDINTHLDENNLETVVSSEATADSVAPYSSNSNEREIIKTNSNKFVYFKVKTKEPIGEVKLRDESFVIPTMPGEELITTPALWVAKYEDFVYTSDIYEIDQTDMQRIYKKLDDYCNSLQLRFFIGHLHSQGEIIDRKYLSFSTYQEASDNRFSNKSQY